MALTNAQKQARWREKREALAWTNPDLLERELLQAAERSPRLPADERAALADKLADAAMGHLRRSQELARVAMKVRGGASCVCYVTVSALEMGAIGSAGIPHPNRPLISDAPRLRLRDLPAFGKSVDLAWRVCMALSNAERQRRLRARRDALAKQSPSELVRRIRDLDKRKLSADGRARMAKELSELAAAYRRHAAAVRVVRSLRS